MARSNFETLVFYRKLKTVDFFSESLAACDLKVGRLPGAQYLGLLHVMLVYLNK